MTTAAPMTATSNAPGDAARPGRAPWWVLMLGVLVFAVTVFYLANSVLPPMLDTNGTIPAGGFDHGPGGPPGPGGGP